MVKKSHNHAAEPCPCTGTGLVRFLQAGILCVLARGDMHGYQVAEEIARLSSFAGQKPDVGGLYRTLRCLDERGLCKSRWDAGSLGPAKRIYQITPAGRTCLSSWVATLREYRTSIDQLTNDCLAAGKPSSAPAGRPRRQCCCKPTA